jgi:RNA polymerase sigma factor (sigma-70 family)
MSALSGQHGLEDSTVGDLYQRYWLVLLTAIRQSVSSQEDAEDVLLEVFLAAIEYETLSAMSAQHQEAWLRRVAYNKCMDFHRRAARRPAVPLESYAETLYQNEDLSPEHVALHREELAQLREHFASLPLDQQELLRLRFADDLPCSQIALRLHKGEGAIRMTISRTLNRLRNIYTKKREGNRYVSR